MKLRDMAFFGIAAAVVAAVALTVDIKTPAEYYALHPAEVAEDGAYITLRVDCSAVADKSRNLPDDGILLEGRYALAAGDTVFDVADRVLRFEGLSFDYSGVGTVYVNGIGGLCELDYGAQSGWIYTVDGESPDVSCVEYEPTSGDEIAFIYVDKYYGEAGS